MVSGGACLALQSGWVLDRVFGQGAGAVWCCAGGYLEAAAGQVL